ncbi:hypothetical protein SLEP1_g56266 [Rubroshorea leprosula]|uniref:Uncharacterized protein n=1 Tax=Rubroshorea leprosula TaxID=152421 RepID=A0AAV5MJ31_9ROSI|nr:hypothetical protein SLEP1_g56266 [Rubroshorea leprosula]
MKGSSTADSTRGGCPCCSPNGQNGTCSFSGFCGVSFLSHEQESSLFWI